MAKGFKSGGRKRGAPNGPPQMKPLRIQLAELNFNLGAALIDELNNTEKAEYRVKLLELLVKYTNCVPQIETYVKPQLEDEADEDDTESLLLAVQ